MKLRRLHIARLPGIDDPYTLDGLDDGFLLVVGPNGIGKSSLCRAMRALLWADGGAAVQVRVSALFEHEGERWSVERDGSRHRWQREGVDSEPPPLPAAHLRRSFFLGLRDLLDTSNEAGQDVAARIRRQMSGGFDLEAVAKQTFPAIGPRFGRGERNALDKKDREARTAEQRQVELGREEARLQELGGRVAGAAEAQRRLTSFDRGLELLQLRDRQLRAQTELDTLPAALERLGGRESEQLTEYESDLQEKRNQRRQRSEDLNGAREEESAAGLPEPLDEAALDAWSARADRLAALEADLARAEEDWRARQGAAAEAGRKLGAHGTAPPDIDLSGDRDLFVFLREARQAETRREVIEERLSLLSDKQMRSEDRAQLARLRLGVEPLRAWLRAPEPSGGSIAGRPGWQVLLIVACVLVALGAGLWARIHPAFAGVVGLGVGLVALAWFSRPDFAAAQARAVARRGYPEDLDAPAEWALGGVTARLRALESQIAELEATAKRSRDRDVERENLANQRDSEASRARDLEQRRRALAKQLALDEIPPDAELVDAARALDQLRSAREAESSAEQRAKRLAEQVGTQRSEIASFLRDHGAGVPTDAASARAGIRKLVNRDKLLRAARLKQVNAEQALVGIDEDIAGIEAAVSGIYERAGLAPGDRVGLAQLIDKLQRYRELRTESDGLANSIKLACASLESAGEAELAERDAEQLAEQRHTLEAQAEELQELTSQVGNIRAEVRQAREGHALEEVLDSRAAALSDLGERHAEALRAEAGRFLLASVKRDHETIQMPRVLERARKLFATFTQDTYELRVAPEDDGSFIAVELQTGAGLRPDELSDGTRAQLLLAAQLAFGEEAEQGTQLPLFLDEALDHSDPVRFHAIAKSLGRMVQEEGRQILYLTNDPSDAARIQSALREDGCAPAREIDLAEIRKRAAGVSSPVDIEVAPLPAVPDPSGETPEGYAARLGVPPLDPRRGSRGQHLFHLLWDDLPLLQRLLQRRLDWVGQWVAVSETGSALAREVAGETVSGGQLRARAALLDEFCRSWGEGRGRPVDRDAIERSDAIRERYLDAVVEIAGELRGDAENLIALLHSRTDPRMQGFRVKAGEHLEAFLTDEGYLDRRPILTEREVAARVMATPAAADLPDALAGACVHRWWKLSERRSTRED